MKSVVIIGAGGFGREVAEIAKFLIKEGSDLRLLGYIDEDKKLHGKVLNDVPVLGNLQWKKESFKGDKLYFVCAIGDPKIKKQVVERALNLGYSPYSLIHPSVQMGADVKIGEGAVICPGSSITTNISIGNHVIINQLCSIGHDVVIEDYVTINPLSAVSGGVHLGQGVFVGTAASILQYIKIGQWSVVGSGASVIKSLEEFVLAVGVPAIVKKKLI